MCNNNYAAYFTIILSPLKPPLSPVFYSLWIHHFKCFLHNISVVCFVPLCIHSVESNLGTHSITVSENLPNGSIPSQLIRRVQHVLQDKYSLAEVYGNYY